MEQRISGVSAIPIPSTMLLFGSGLMGLISMRRKLKV
ncbi:MAG: PEP-CTERM sorting domain-containing protein [Cocleimonas sp.]|nr:PEP-CTERM sorting domain-containing protein [Cocleimonas sp.]